MRRKERNGSLSGLGFAEALTILFIAYKLAGLITWDWIWVLSPLWITFSICAVLAFIALVVDAVQDYLDDSSEE